MRGSSTKLNAAIILKHSNAIEEVLTIVKKVLAVDVCERCLKRRRFYQWISRNF
jgi:hypothetical protein